MKGADGLLRLEFLRASAAMLSLSFLGAMGPWARAWRHYRRIARSLSLHSTSTRPLLGALFASGEISALSLRCMVAIEKSWIKDSKNRRTAGSELPEFRGTE
jgi:hypothetical protein